MAKGPSHPAAGTGGAALARTLLLCAFALDFGPGVWQSPGGPAWARSTAGSLGAKRDANDAYGSHLYLCDAHLQVLGPTRSAVKGGDRTCPTGLMRGEEAFERLARPCTLLLVGSASIPERNTGRAQACVWEGLVGAETTRRRPQNPPSQRWSSVTIIAFTPFAVPCTGHRRPLFQDEVPNGGVLLPSLQMRKLRPRQATRPAQCHLAKRTTCEAFGAGTQARAFSTAEEVLLTKEGSGSRQVWPSIQQSDGRASGLGVTVCPWGLGHQNSLPGPGSQRLTLPGLGAPMLLPVSAGQIAKKNVCTQTISEQWKIWLDAPQETFLG